MATGKSHATPTSDGELEAEITARVIGRYILHSRIAAGGMASVYLGSVTGAADFSRVVAIKRMHPQFAADSEFTQRFRGEAWLNSRLVHPNIVQILDVVEWGDELLLVMEYIHGVTLGALIADSKAAGSRLPCSVATGIFVQVLYGLHAAHVATDDEGRALGIVHRDFSPQNIIISRDGQAKVLDFGIARVRTQVPITAIGQVAGKYGYLAPEQIGGQEVDQRTDIFAAGIVLWEVLTGDRLFREPNLCEASVISLILSKTVPPPSQINPIIPPALDEIVLRALNRDPARRFASAREMAVALETAFVVASPSQISACLTDLSASRLARLTRTLARARRAAALVSHALVAETAVSPDIPENQKTVVSAPFNESPIPPASAPAVFWKWLVPLLGALVLLGVWAVLRGGGRVQPRASLSGTPTPSQVPELRGDPSAPSLSASLLQNSGEPSTRLPPAAASESASRSKAPPTLPRARAPASRSVAPKASGPARLSRPPQSAAAKPNCDPPTFTDADGIRHFKDGCL